MTIRLQVVLHGEQNCLSVPHTNDWFFFLHTCECRCLNWPLKPLDLKLTSASLTTNIICEVLVMRLHGGTQGKITRVR